MPDTIRVLIADDHPVVRHGLADFLLAYPEFELAAQARDGAEAVSLARRERPDVVLMDMMMPELDGVEATRQIRQACPATQVVALTSFREEDLVQRALQAGAIGYLLKNATAEELAQAIRSATAGRPTLAPEATQALIHANILARTPQPGHDLTDREREILGLMAEGLNNIQIAERMTISRSTVKFHVSNILAKLGVATRVEAVSLALQQHLVR